MFSKILVPLDAARDAETALPLAETLAKQLDAEVVLIAVLPEDVAVSPVLAAYEAALARMAETRRVAALAYLDGIRERLLRNGVPASTAVRVGPVAATIVEMARTEGAGLIAMATHGQVGPQRWFLGSVADEVARSAEVPVLLVRPGEAGTVVSEPPTDIIVPLDGSALAERALPIAVALAKTFGAPVTIVRTVAAGWWSMDAGMYVELPDIIEAIEAEAREYLDVTANSLKAQGIEVATRFSLFAPPDRAVEEVAVSARRPLVVMTSHGRSGLARVVLGSVADRIVRNSSAPVLIVRGEPRA